MTLERIAAFVRTHAFPAIVRDGKVHFAIPYIGREGESGVFWYSVRTLDEARRALGY